MRVVMVIAAGVILLLLAIHLSRRRTIRDPQRIFQNGVAVGDVAGVALDAHDTVVFARLVNTGELNPDTPIEYKGRRLRIASIGARKGMKPEFKGEDSVVLINVMEDVRCVAADPKRIRASD